MIQFIPVSFSEIPVQFLVNIQGVDYNFLFRHNSRFDFVTVEISKDNVLIASSKLVYGNNIMSGFLDGISIPLIPLSESDFSKDSTLSDFLVNKDTFGNSVFIYFDDGSN